MATIYESQKIDFQTGELVTSHTIKTHKSLEHFLFTRTTEGLEWLKDFQSMQDFRTFLIMVEFQEYKSGITIFTGVQVKETADMFNCTPKTIQNSISSLIKSGFVYKIATSNYLTNPKTFYKGSSMDLKEKLLIWEKLKKPKEELENGK